MNIKAHPYLSQINAYKPGKSKIDGDSNDVIKLSSNENALGSSPEALNCYKNHAEEMFRYADGSCSQLRYAIAQKNQINEDQIVCGAGSDEIITFLTAAFAGPGDEIIYSEHGFLMYPISAKRVGAEAVKAKETNLKTDIEEVLSKITAKTRIIFIANPNNPTGSYIDEKEVKELIKRTPKDILIVLDHAYEEFAQETDYPDAIKLVNENENVVVTRTFSKIYGLASLRIGWCYSSLEIADILNKVRGPFNVGGPAQFAATAALKDENFFQESIHHNKKWLEFFYKEFSKTNKIKAHPSIANFILLDFGDTEICKKANQNLLSQGIILREMTSYNLPNCLRLTIGTEEENLRVLKSLQEFIKNEL